MIMITKTLSKMFLWWDTVRLEQIEDTGAYVAHEKKQTIKTRHRSSRSSSRLSSQTRALSWPSANRCSFTLICPID